MYLVLSVCASVCNQFCKQDISKHYLCIYAKFIADAPDALPGKWLIFGAEHIQYGWQQMPKICNFYTGHFQSVISGAL